MVVYDKSALQSITFNNEINLWIYSQGIHVKTRHYPGYLKCNYLMISYNYSHIKSNEEYELRTFDTNMTLRIFAKAIEKETNASNGTFQIIDILETKHLRLWLRFC